MPEVFVYGTLKRGGRLHHILESGPCRFLRTAELNGFKMYRFDWYPAIVPAPGTVQGEVFDVPEDLLSCLDRVEGVPKWYRREKVDGMWVYVFNQSVDEAAEIEDGNWPV